MARAPQIVGGLAALLVLVAAGYALRSASRTPEGAPLLTAVPQAASFSPRELPDAPVLTSASTQNLAVDFGYQVGGTSYAYTLALSFPAEAEAGKATLSARHAGKTANAEMPALRIWDPPRETYVVAIQGRPDIEPAVPALCLRAVVGPSKAHLDLSHASLCVAQRDGAGVCHPETLACGQIRSRS